VKNKGEYWGLREIITQSPDEAKGEDKNWKGKKK